MLYSIWPRGNEFLTALVIYLQHWSVYQNVLSLHYCSIYIWESILFYLRECSICMSALLNLHLHALLYWYRCCICMIAPLSRLICKDAHSACILYLHVWLLYLYGCSVCMGALFFICMFTLVVSVTLSARLLYLQGYSICRVALSAGLLYLH